MLIQKADHRQHETRRTEAALQGMTFMKGLLHRVERRVGRRQAFDRRHLVPLGLHREHQAGPDRRSIEEHGAAPANTVLAPNVRAGEAEVVAKMI
jgi:hypothetical protein